MNGRAAKTFNRVLRTSQDVAGVVAGRSTVLNCVAGDSDRDGKCPTSDIVADREE